MIEVGEDVGHYRVIDRLGEGGMGEVFLAQDLHLDRQVALKVMTSSRAANRQARERFHDEANLLSKLDHPNIVTVHEFGWTPDGIAFIVMALAPGRSVRDRLSDGNLSVSEAYEVAIQTARGLEHLHAKKIVHRDIKPSNLMVTESDDGRIGTVKIVDLGIAKGPEGEDHQRRTREGGILGSRPYMSPEQQWAQTKIDPPADIYAFGVALYEMLAGEVPSSGAPVRYSDLKGKHEGLSRKDSAVLKGLVSIINRCLEKKPEARYGSGADLLQGLSCLAGSRRPKLWPLAAGLPLFFIVGLLLLSVPQVRGPVERLVSSFIGPTSHYVAVLPFSSNDSTDVPMALGLARSLTTAVAGFGAGADSIWVVPFNDIEASGVTSPEDARKTYPVDLIISGEIRRKTEGIDVLVRVLSARGERPQVILTEVLPDPYGGSYEEAAHGFLTRVLRLRGFGEARNRTIPSPEGSPALRYYVPALGYLQRHFSEGSLEAAIELFETALAQDPSFAPAYAGLCEAAWEKYQLDGDVSEAAKARAMCGQAVTLTQDDPTALTALGRTQLNTGQPQEALATLLQAISIDPTSAEAYRWLGRVHESLGDYERAEEAYLEAIDLQPGIWIYHNELGIMYGSAERHEEALEHHLEVTRLSPDNYLGYAGVGAALMGMNRTEEAEAQFFESIRKQPNFLAYRNLGQLNLRVGRYQQAVTHLQDALAINEEDWVSWRWLAHAFHWLGRGEEEQEAWLQVVSLTEPAVAINPRDHYRLGGLAEAYVALGDAETGRLYLDRLTTLSPAPIYNLYLAGRISEMLGNRDAALEYIRRAMEQGYDSLTVELDPWLSDLRTDPRFQSK